jgi:hypothetical protein
MYKIFKIICLFFFIPSIEPCYSQTKISVNEREFSNLSRGELTEKVKSQFLGAAESVSHLLLLSFTANSKAKDSTFYLRAFPKYLSTTFSLLSFSNQEISLYNLRNTFNQLLQDDSQDKRILKEAEIQLREGKLQLRSYFNFGQRKLSLKLLGTGSVETNMLSEFSSKDIDNLFSNTSFHILNKYLRQTSKNGIEELIIRN